MSHHRVQTEAAPAAIGPYSQAIAVDRGEGRLVFASGQIPLDPRTGELVAGDVAEQVDRVMQNLAAVLEAAGSGLDRMLKVTIFLADMNDFAVVNEVYGRYVADPPPARATVEVSRLPKDVAVEIEAIART